MPALPMPTKEEHLDFLALPALLVQMSSISFESSPLAQLFFILPICLVVPVYEPEVLFYLCPLEKRIRLEAREGLTKSNFDESVPSSLCMKYPFSVSYS